MNYSKKVLDHFLHPRNMGIIKKPDRESQVGNPVCGDIMKIHIKLGKRKTKDGTEEEFIKDIKFQTLGCAAAIASSSMATELIKGKSVKEALAITNKAVAEALDGLPKVKMHCSVLIEEAIKKALSSEKY